MLQFTPQGWPNNLELNNLESVELASCCTRVITGPLIGRLHAEHLGMVKMRQLARKLAFYGLDLISKLGRQLSYVMHVKNLLNRQHPPRLLLGPGQADHITYRFCWALSWQDVFGRSGCLFQIFGDDP